MVVLGADLSHPIMDISRFLTDGQEDQFFRLAKQTGFSVKQLAPVTGVPMPTLYKKWKNIRIDRRRKARAIRKRHRERIVELVLLGFDSFEIGEALAYEPYEIIRFIEKECGPGTWKWRKCDNCLQDFISFDGIRVCSMTDCRQVNRAFKEE